MVCVSVVRDSGVKTLSDFFFSRWGGGKEGVSRPCRPLRNGRRDLVGCNLQGPGGAGGGLTALL